MHKPWVFLVAFSWLVSCSPSPQPISFGQDSCDYCKMTIVDPKFSSELVTRKGKVYKFDSIECLAGFVMEKMPDRNKIHSLWVANFNQPDQFLPAATAVFL
ncbi:MAG: nitrous oxide reductase, partial [Calditrichaeota bacterium]